MPQVREHSLHELHGPQVPLIRLSRPRANWVFSRSIWYTWKYLKNREMDETKSTKSFVIFVIRYPWNRPFRGSYPSISIHLHFHFISIITSSKLCQISRRFIQIGFPITHETFDKRFIMHTNHYSSSRVRMRNSRYYVITYWPRCN